MNNADSKNDGIYATAVIASSQMLVRDDSTARRSSSYQLYKSIETFLYDWGLKVNFESSSSDAEDTTFVSVPLAASRMMKEQQEPAKKTAENKLHPVTIELGDEKTALRVDLHTTESIHGAICFNPSMFLTVANKHRSRLIEWARNPDLHIVGVKDVVTGELGSCYDVVLKSLSGL